MPKNKEKIIKNLKDLVTDNLLDKVDLEDSEHWGWGFGGGSLENSECSITYCPDPKNRPFHEVRYKLPEFINYMLKMQFKFGKEEKVRELHKVLEI